MKDFFLAMDRKTLVLVVMAVGYVLILSIRPAIRGISHLLAARKKSIDS